MFSYKHFSQLLKYTSYKTIKVILHIFKNKQIPIIKCKDSIFECKKYEFGKFKKIFYKITANTYLRIANEYIDNSLGNKTLKILGVKKLASTIKYLNYLYDLNKIRIDCSQLVHIPKSIGKLTSHLHSLFFDGNHYSKLTRLPKSIGKLSHLQVLYICGTQISSLPKSIGELSNLRELWISMNQIKYIPKSISKLSNLQKINLCHNRLQHIPKSISNLFNLQKIFISNNSLTRIPKFICNLTNLKVLYLNNNYLKNIPVSINNLTNLQTLRLDNNYLKNISNSINNLFNLQYFTLWNNEFDANTINNIKERFSFAELYDT
jgi:hypothetical protein